MARIARVVIPGYPHHIIQRGNRRQRVFFSDNDKKSYLDFLRIYAKQAGIAIWGYCLMDNHVHLIAVPDTEESLAAGLAETHRRYTRMINFREGWRGYLWEGRFKSFSLSQNHLLATLRYIERNPVRAGIVSRAEEYKWSSARAHVYSIKNSLLSDNFIISDIKDWRAFINQENDENEANVFIKHANTGRPLGDSRFISEVERITGRNLRKQKSGPKPKHKILN